MEDINIDLKPKKKSFLDKLTGLFEDKRKRALYVILFILPFVIAIGIFGFVAYREAKNLINLATGNEEAIDAYSIPSMNYKLRANATEYQQECFAELKDAVEYESSPETIVGLVGKNYVADFYTWTNKQGQYDIGGMEYVNSEKNETIEYKTNIYMKARDGFYKYINKYMNDYGVENLIEVNNINVVSVTKNSKKYTIHEYTETIQTGEDSWEKLYADVDHDCYNVSLTWSYKPETKMDLSNFATSINLLIIENDGRYEIVEASENTINVEELEEEDDELESEYESDTESGTDSEEE